MFPEAQAYSGRVWWRDEEGEEIASLGVLASAQAVTLPYTLRWPRTDWDPEHVRYTIPVTWTPCHYGGRRPWFLCPGRNCGRRVAKLYLPLDGSAKYYLCRHCYGLAYESQRQALHNRFLQKACRIKRRLGGGRATCTPSRRSLRECGGARTGGFRRNTTRRTS